MCARTYNSQSRQYIESSYIAQCKIIRISFHVITCSIEQHLSNNAAINARILFVHKYPPLSIARNSFRKLSELDQSRVKKLAQGLTPQHNIRHRVLLVKNPMI